MGATRVRLGIGWTGAARDHVLSTLAARGGGEEGAPTGLVGPRMDGPV
jgi:hypothetical protein